MAAKELRTQFKEEGKQYSSNVFPNGKISHLFLFSTFFSKNQWEKVRKTGIKVGKMGKSE